MRSKWDITPERGTRNLRPIGAIVTAIGVAVCTVALVVGGGSTPATVESAVRPTNTPAPSTEATVGSAPALLPAEAAVARVPAGAPTQTASAPAVAPTTSGSAVPAEAAEATPPGQPPKVDDVPGEWVVELHEGESPGEVASAHGAEVDHVYDAALDGFSASMTEEEALEAAGDPRVASIVRDRRVYATEDAMPTGIPRSHAVEVAAIAGTGTTVDADVAIVDTGIADHADLNRQEGKNCINSSRAAVDGDGHGTHVAGTVGAKDNGSGVVGVAPGARVWAVKVLDDNGSGTWSQVICGLNWVAQNASLIEVANMSLGGSGSGGSDCGSSALHQATCNVVEAGVTVVVAAGNSSTNASKHVPAAFDEVITVSALADFDGRPGGAGNDTCRSDEDDTLANFSNYGPAVDLIAPGVCILSTWKGGGTKTISGTSMASPHVAGAAAAYLAEAAPNATPAQVLNALRANGNFQWTGDRGDGGQEPLLDLTFLGGTGLPASGGGGGGGTGTITAAGKPGTYDSGTKSKVKITWSGVLGANVDIRRSDTPSGPLVVIKTTGNDGAYTNKLGTKLPSGATRTYQVCAAGSSTTCSDPFTVTF